MRKMVSKNLHTILQGKMIKYLLYWSTAIFGGLGSITYINIVTMGTAILCFVLEPLSEEG